MEVHQEGAAWLTDSKAGKLLNTACGFAWGAVAAACSGVYAAAYAVQGRWGAAAKTAAMGLGSAVGGGTAMRAVAKSGVAVARNAKYAKRGAGIRGAVNRYRYAAQPKGRSVRTGTNIYVGSKFGAYGIYDNYRKR